MEIKTMKATIEEMAVGQSVEFPIDRIYSVRSTTSVVSLILERKYKTKADRERRVVIVTRMQ